MIRGQLLLQNLARLATLCHRINVNVRKCMPLALVRVSREDTLIVVKNELEELILNVFPP